MAVVVPFPASRRQRFIARQAERAAELNPDAGERHIKQQVEIQTRAMLRKGIDPAVIDREMQCFEAAIRRALWDAVMGGPKSAS